MGIVYIPDKWAEDIIKKLPKEQSFKDFAQNAVRDKAKEEFDLNLEVK